MDFDLYLNLYKGLYLQFYAPVARTKWGIKTCEDVRNNGLETPFPAGYMAEGQVEPPIASASKALQGGITFGQVQEGIKFGRFCCENTTTKLADFTFALGYLFLNREDGYVGVNAFATAPTGTRPRVAFL